jgi:hypothetical protein
LRVQPVYGRARTLELGNLALARDWGWAPEFADAMLRIVAFDSPEDFVVANGETNTLEDFVAKIELHFLNPYPGPSSAIFPQLVPRHATSSPNIPATRPIYDVRYGGAASNQRDCLRTTIALYSAGVSRIARTILQPSGN